MLKTRFFGPGFNPLKVPLRVGVNAGTAFSATAVRGIKYTGGRYYIWGVTTSGDAFIATSLDLLTWSGYTSGGSTFYDVSSSGSVVVIVGTSTLFSTNTVWTVNPTLSVGSINSYYPASLSEPRYVEWCSGFSKFIISAYSNRAYSNDATGTTWTVASYTGIAGYRPGSLLYSPEIGSYYDVRVSSTTTEYEVYTGATAAALTSIYTGGNINNASINRRKLFYRAGPGGTHQISIFSQIHFNPSPGYSIIGVDIWNSTFSSLYATIQNVQTSTTALVGATYLPAYGTYIGKFAFGLLSAITIANPTTISTQSPYNVFNLLPTSSIQDSNTLIYSPAGMVTIADNGQIYTNP